MDAHKSAIFALFVGFLYLLLLFHDLCWISRNLGQKKYFTEHHTPWKQYTYDLRDSVLPCKIHGCYCKYAKISSSNIPFLSIQAIIIIIIIIIVVVVIIVIIITISLFKVERIVKYW